MLNILTKSTLLKKGLKQPKVLKCASLAVLETNNPLTKKRNICVHQLYNDSTAIYSDHENRLFRW